MTTKEYYDKKAVEMHYEDFLHWIDCYDYELQPQKIIDWTDELVKKLTIPVVSGTFICGKCNKPTEYDDWCKKCYDEYYKED